MPGLPTLTWCSDALGEAHTPPLSMKPLAVAPIGLPANDGYSLIAVAASFKKYPSFAGKPIGATATMFIEMEGIDAFHDAVKPKVKITMPIVTQFYGMREFAIEDPDGYLITFAERQNG